ncbi:hypothetical protein PULV_a3943 [Pseudoalteromonas ulvae UL12]|uniref:hypothetical protein n=1 Tax=Pseudoalteromonas ulvae TaxID=107327 RepID=UPI00186B5EDD|nr:hypothetical protein [Pseudoalteromonas ulvae]MBE0362139.1 hypothetical protein [Pseudoalteromonas ulvae UL12]
MQNNQIFSRRLIIPKRFKLTFTETTIGEQNKRPALSVSFVCWDPDNQKFANDLETKVSVSDADLVSLVSVLHGYKREFSHPSAGGVLLKIQWNEERNLNVFSTKKVEGNSAAPVVKSGFVNNPLELHELSLFALSVLIRLWNRDGFHGQLTPGDVLPLLARLNQISIKGK